MAKHARQYARYRRDQNPNMVFADIRAPVVPGVDVLLQPIRATVDAVDPDTCQVSFSQACAFVPGGIISCAGQPLEVLHHDSDALWVEDVSHVQVGDVVTQTKFVGRLDELEEAFVSAWKARWMRHVDVPASRWETIVNLAKRYMPEGQFAWNP